MKKFTLILSIIFSISIFSLTDLQAQNTKPDDKEAISQTNTELIFDVNQGLNSTEERKINIVVEDQKPD